MLILPQSAIDSLFPTFFYQVASAEFVWRSALTLLLTACFASTVLPRGACTQPSLLGEASFRLRSPPWQRVVAEECWQRFFSTIHRACGWIRSRVC